MFVRLLVLPLLSLVPVALAQDISGDPHAADTLPERGGAASDPLAAEDWAGIRAAYDAGRLAVRSEAGGFTAGNPGQRWRATFDGRGFVVTPDGGGWSWGLELVGYGFAGDEREVTTPARVHAEGGRVAYEWDGALEEWYRNDRKGLEHGFTVGRRPAGHEQDPGRPLRFALSVRGGLLPEVTADGRGVRFLNEEGAAVLTYLGLTVIDADGREVKAYFEGADTGLRLVIEEDGARYPLTIDPIAQQAYLKASNADEEDGFGTSVAISGDTVVVGAPLEDSGATGVNGDQSDGSQWDAGAAYVFVRHGASWSQQAYLKASNAETFDYFGDPVAVSGDTIVVGAQHEDSNATGVNGDQYSDFASNSGAAYVFVRNGTTWSQEAYLKASNAEGGELFGERVAVSGNTVLVATSHERSGATGVNGDQSDNSVQEAGAAYVFVRSGTNWTQQAYLKASNTEKFDYFGDSAAVSGDTVLIGAWHEDSHATGVNGDQSDNSLYAPGAAYVFARSGTTWSQQAYLKASNTGEGDAFGWSVSVSGDTAVVGAVGEDSSATGVDGNQADDSLENAGAAYVFARAGTSWSQRAYLKGPSTGYYDKFGESVSASGSTVVVGARGEDSNATGVNGDPTDDSLHDAGAADVFDLDAPLATCLGTCGTGVNAGTDGFAIMGPANIGGTFTATVTGCAPGNVASFLVAYATPLILPSAWGEILVNIADPGGELLGMPTSPGNPALFTLGVPNDPVFAGFVFHTQAASFGGTLCLHCAHACTVGY